MLTGMAGPRTPLTDRLVARAFALAIDPAAVSTESAAVRRLADADHDALRRALEHLEWRYVDRPSRIAESAADVLRLALSTRTGAARSATPQEIDIS
jgi:hypothetical protein